MSIDPKKIVEALALVLAALRSEDRQRILSELLAMDGQSDEMRTGPSHSEEPPGPSVWGMSLEEFKAVPYYAIGHGKLRDGPKGTSKKNLMATEGDKAVICHLFAEGQIHMVEIIAYQLQDSTGTLERRAENGRSRVSNIRKLLRPSGVTIEQPHRGSWVYILDRPLDGPIAYSVDRVKPLLDAAEASLEQGSPEQAFDEALEAIGYEPHLLPAHEIFLRAACYVPEQAKSSPKAIRNALRIVEKRAGRLNDVLVVIGRSLSELDPGLEEQVREFRDQFTAESARLTCLMEQVRSDLGHLVRRTPEDEKANTLIEKLRREGWSVDQALNNPGAQPLLKHKKVERLRNRAVQALGGKADINEIARARQHANVLFLMHALDPRKPADINAVCKAAEYDLYHSSAAKDRKFREMQNRHGQLMDAEGVWFASNGENPSDEDLARQLGWTTDEIGEVRAFGETRSSGDVNDLGDADSDQNDGDSDEEKPRRNGLTEGDEEPFGDDPEWSE